MTYIFKILGGGDTMTGMTRAVYGFVIIIAVIAIMCITIVVKNYLTERKKDSVSLKSKKAERKQAEANKGLFNYDIIDGDDEEDVGVDITDPRNRKKTGKHKHAAGRIPRKGLKPVTEQDKKLTVQSNAPRVGLRRQQTTVQEPAPFEPSNTTNNANNNANMNNTFDDGMMSFDDNMNGSIQPNEPHTSIIDNQPMSFDDSNYENIQLDGIGSNNNVQSSDYQQPMPVQNNQPVIQPVNGTFNAPAPLPQQYAGPVQQPTQPAPVQNSNPFMDSNAGNAGMPPVNNPVNPFAHIINPSDIK